MKSFIDYILERDGVSLDEVRFNPKWHGLDRPHGVTLGWTNDPRIAKTLQYLIGAQAQDHLAYRVQYDTKFRNQFYSGGDNKGPDPEGAKNAPSTHAYQQPHKGIFEFKASPTPVLYWGHRPSDEYYFACSVSKNMFNDRTLVDMRMQLDKISNNVMSIRSWDQPWTQVEKDDGKAGVVIIIQPKEAADEITVWRPAS